MTIQYFIERRASSVTLFVFCCNHKLIAVKSNILLPSTTKPSQNMFQLQLAAASLNCKGGNPVCASMYSSPQKNMDSGYPLDWFVQKVPEKFICEICGKVLQSPRATPCCSNMFCLHCLEFWIEYYGVCPKRCAEIEADTLQKVIGIEKTIQTLQVYCKYSSNGCKAKMAIEEKLKHEKKCPNKQDEQTNLEEIETIQRKTSTQSSQDTYVEMASVACRNKTSVGDHDSESRVNLHPIFTGDLAYYTYNLTRRSPGESLGFVLVAGAKNSNGKAVNFSIKTVNPNTVAAEVGLLPGDRIVQVDNIPLSQMAQPEAISKIKDNPHVILTVIRNNPMKKASKKQRRRVEDHVYEDILDSEEQNSQLLLQPERFRERLGGYTDDELIPIHRHRKMSEPRTSSRNLSPTYHSDSSRSNPRLLSEKMSKDSGLSSGSSSASHHHFNRQVKSNGDLNLLDQRSSSKHSYRSEREAMKKNIHDKDLTEEFGLPMLQPYSNNNDLDVEEIFLQKNGTNQLGITLGYDTKSSSGNLIVCEIVSDGLAAQDGRLRKGDIIQKVNGFEVYDPEEAILLFLEQDQDITLTVARKIKPLRRRHNMLASKSQSSLNTSHIDNTELRRTDSCGSLDSITLKEHIGQTTPSRRYSDSSRHRHKTSLGSTGRMFNAATVSSGYITGPESTTLSTDFVFRPIINETRPATAGEVLQPNHTRYLRSTTSLGSDPDRSINNGYHHQFQTPVSRHRSFESSDHHRLRSPPSTNNKGFGYRAPSPLKNSSRLFFSDNPRMTDQVVPVDRIMMHRSISNFRCESLV